MIGLSPRAYVGGPVTIDGSYGEGGGQVLRTALGLSLASGRPFRLENIRRRRLRSGLLRQHAAAVSAAAMIGDASAIGGEIGSETLVFKPGSVAHGPYAFAIGNGGSTSLLLHSVLPGLLSRPGTSELVIEGGTETAGTPSFDHLAEVYLPLLRTMSVDARVELGRRGFFPAGGGRITVHLRGGRPRPITLEERGRLVGIEVVARLGEDLPRRIAEKELALVGPRLGLRREAMRVEIVPTSSAGNALSATLRFEHATEVFASVGERRIATDRVADALVTEVVDFLDRDVPVSAHTADQLVLLLALAGGGSFRTCPPTEHTRTQIALAQVFLDVEFSVEESARSARIAVRPLDPSA